jgi:hypothetical protein
MKTEEEIQEEYKKLIILESTTLRTGMIQALMWVLSDNEKVIP